MANFLHSWTLDSNWAWQSSGGVDSINTPAALALETSFNVDANRDGIIGVPLTAVEAQGNTRLLRTAEGKAFVEYGSAIRQEVTAPWNFSVGSDVTDWQMLAAETISGENRILWRNNAANFLHTWILDSNWGWQTSAGSFNPASAEGLALLTQFGLA
jgi:hypothetical protein